MYKHILILGLILLVAGFVASPVMAQCAVPNVKDSCATNTFPTPDVVNCTKSWRSPTVSLPMGCGSGMGNNVVLCAFGSVGNLAYLVARANTTAPAIRTCSLTCSCGTIVINNASGLPVELLEFSVEVSLESKDSRHNQDRIFGVSPEQKLTQK